MAGLFSRLFKRGGHVMNTCSRCGGNIPTLGTSLADAIKRAGGNVVDSAGRRIDPFQDPDLATPLYDGQFCIKCTRVFCSKCVPRFKKGSCPNLRCPACAVDTLRQL